MWHLLKQHYGIYYGGYKLSLQMRCWLPDRGGRERSEGGKVGRTRQVIAGMQTRERADGGKERLRGNSDSLTNCLERDE